MTDVLAIDRRHERAIEGAEDLVGDLVARVLDVLQVARLALDVDEVRQQVMQQPRALQGVGGAAIEKIEEALILRDQSQSSQHVLTIRALVWRIARRAWRSRHLSRSD